MVRACLAGADDDLVARAQLAADGVPFLVEEVLASPGVPDSFAEMVRSRLAGFSPHLSRLLAAGPAVTDGWGDPVRWLESAHADFAAKDFGDLAEWCQDLLSAPVLDRLARFGMTAREAEILALVAAGWLTRRSRPGCISRTGPLRSTSRACCARPAPRRAPCSPR